MKENCYLLQFNNDYIIRWLMDIYSLHNTIFIIMNNYRALLFFELIFQQIIVSLQTNNNEVDMNKIYNMAYEGSVKKYHNWITQQLFAVC